MTTFVTLNVIVEPERAAVVVLFRLANVVRRILGRRALRGWVSFLFGRGEGDVDGWMDGGRKGGREVAC